MAILKRHLPPRLPGRDELDLNAIAQRCDEFSGGDLANLAYKACVMLLERWDQGEVGDRITEKDFFDGIEEIKVSQVMMKEADLCPGAF